MSGGKKKQWECVLHAKSVEKSRKESKRTRIDKGSTHFFISLLLPFLLSRLEKVVVPDSEHSE